VSEQSLGEKLKELREQQGLSHEQLYAKTKILTKYIEAIEDGRWDLLPGQAYLRPFVKSMADALGADYSEFAQLIEKTSPVKPVVVIEEVKPKQGGFDYRWVAVVVFILLIALIVFIFRPLGGSKETETTAPPVVSAELNHRLEERAYSSNLDLEHKPIKNDKIHRIELTALDSVWLLLTVEDDTLYAGMLYQNQKIIKEAPKQFDLLLGRSNCVDIIYDGVGLDRNGILLNKKRLRFAEIDLNEIPGSGEVNEGQ